MKKTEQTKREIKRTLDALNTESARFRPLIKKMDNCLNSDVWNSQATGAEKKLVQKIVRGN